MEIKIRDYKIQDCSAILDIINDAILHSTALYDYNVRTLVTQEAIFDEKIQKGFVIKAGPGYPLPMPADEDDLWKGKDDQIKYLPLQAQEGDLAIFLQKGAIEVMYESEKYFIVPQASILMLEREEDL